MNKITIFLLIFFSILIVFNEFYEAQKNDETLLLKESSLKEIDFSSIWSNSLTHNPLYDKIWNVISRKKEDKNDKEEEQKRFDERIFVEQSKKTLCIKGSCYRFLATSKERKESVIFYNEKLKPDKIKAFALHDVLENSVKIVGIDNHSVYLKEINSSQTWQLKMFDINLTKYKPKEIE